MNQSSEPTPDQLERIARLRATRPTASTPNARRRRRHPARRSRIVAAGLGAGTLLGLAALFSLDAAGATTAASPDGPIVVARTSTPSDSSGGQATGRGDAASGSPIRLTGNPVISSVRGSNGSPTGSSSSSTTQAPTRHAATTSGSS